MKKLNRKFTTWYVKRGYVFGYTGIIEPFFICPWYVRPLLIFFSPSVYFQQAYGTKIVEWFEEGINSVSESEKFPAEIFDKNNLKGD